MTIHSYACHLEAVGRLTPARDRVRPGSRQQQVTAVGQLRPSRAPPPTHVVRGRRDPRSSAGSSPPGLRSWTSAAAPALWTSAILADVCPHLGPRHEPQRRRQEVTSSTDDARAHVEVRHRRRRSTEVADVVAAPADARRRPRHRLRRRPRRSDERRCHRVATPMAATLGLAGRCRGSDPWTSPRVDVAGDRST